MVNTIETEPPQNLLIGESWLSTPLWVVHQEDWWGKHLHLPFDSHHFSLSGYLCIFFLMYVFIYFFILIGS